jgi:hypothetical protein
MVRNNTQNLPNLVQLNCGILVIVTFVDRQPRIDKCIRTPVFILFVVAKIHGVRYYTVGNHKISYNQQHCQHSPTALHITPLQNNHNMINHTIFCRQPQSQFIFNGRLDLFSYRPLARRPYVIWNLYLQYSRVCQ